MGFKVEGDYFEACTCAVSCPCVFLAPATEDRCDLILAWHVEKGQSDDVSLDGLNAVMAVHSPQQMTDGNWTVALYLDERATAEQSEALGGVFSGASGGHLANLGPLIGQVVGVSTAPIEFSREGGTRRLRVGDILEATVTETTGMDGENPSVITNPLLGAVTQPVRQAKSEHVTFDGHFTLDVMERNAFITEFTYAG